MFSMSYLRRMFPGRPHPTTTGAAGRRVRADAPSLQQKKKRFSKRAPNRDMSILLQSRSYGVGSLEVYQTHKNSVLRPQILSREPAGHRASSRGHSSSAGLCKE